MKGEVFKGNHKKKLENFVIYIKKPWSLQINILYAAIIAFLKYMPRLSGETARFKGT